jgi:hypothetical protein
MFLNQQKKTQILESSDLQTLLKAISNNSEVLTESEISSVVDIEDVVKSGTKLQLSEEAKLEYYQFLEKVVLLDDSLNEGVIDSVKAIGKALSDTFNKKSNDIEYFNNKYKTNKNSFSVDNIDSVVAKVKVKGDDRDKAILKSIISDIIRNYQTIGVIMNPKHKSDELVNITYNKYDPVSVYKHILTKL